MNDLSEYKAVYLEELDEQLQFIEEEILKLETEGETDTGVQRLFRAAHTLKGSSAAMGFEKMKELTHEMEHLLDKIRRHVLKVTPLLVNLLFKCQDRIANLKAEIVNHNKEVSDILPLIQELKAFALGEPSEHSTDVKSDALPTLNQEEWNGAHQALSKGLNPYWVNVTLSNRSEMKLARACLIETRFQDIGEVIHTNPALMEETADEQFGHMQWLVCVPLPREELQSLVESLADVDIATVSDCDLSTLSVKSVRQVPENTDHEEATNITEKVKTQTIRVNVERLEHLMNLVGELVIDQTRFQQVNKRLTEQYGSAEAVEELGQISDHLTRIIGELQESVMKARMLPIEQLFNRFPRMVRDLTQALGKEVELIIDGKDTELDRTLIDEIGDPLIHLIRNAVDHGIEAPDKRYACGKPTKGMLKIAAAHEDNQVVITVEDDGAGIDPAKIKQAALQKGIISPNEAERLSEQEAVHLIFQPGFSTAITVSDVSGRGVGMDIVHTDIERLNGLIDIDTEVGKGTIFKIRLPLTLAIITGLMVNVSRRTFILPMANVAEIVRVESSDIQTVRGIPVITLRNQVIQVVWMHDIFGYKRMVQPKKYLPLVIVGRAEKRIALVVDELLGNQEVVIKSLGSYIGKVEGVSGATILGDGRVGLILEVASIMKMVGK